MSEKMIGALTTRFSDIASTIRASIYKQGERNLMHNILNGNGYEGVIENWTGYSNTITSVAKGNYVLEIYR